MKLIVLLGISAICFEATLVRSQEPYSGRIGGEVDLFSAGRSGPIYRSDNVGGSRPYVDGVRRTGGERYLPGDSRRSHGGDVSSGRVVSHITGGDGGSYMGGRRDLATESGGYIERGGRGGGLGSHMAAEGRRPYMTRRRGDTGAGSHMAGGSGGTYLDSREGGLYGRSGIDGHDRRYSPEGYISGGSRASGGGRSGGGDRGFGRGGSGGTGERRTGRGPRGRRGHSHRDRPPREGYMLQRGGHRHFPVHGGYCPGAECADGGLSAGVGNGIGTGTLDLMLHRIRTGTNEDIRSYEIETGGYGPGGMGGDMGGGMPGMGGHMGGGVPGMGGDMGGGMPGMGGHMGGGMPGMGGHMGGGMPDMGGPPGMVGPLGTGMSSVGGGGMFSYDAPMGGHMPGMGGPIMY